MFCSNCGAKLRFKRRDSDSKNQKDKEKTGSYYQCRYCQGDKPKAYVSDLYKETKKQCNAYLTRTEKAKKQCEKELLKLDARKEKLDKRIRAFGKAQLTMYEMHKAGKLTDEEYEARCKSFNENRGYKSLFDDVIALETDYIDIGIILMSITAHLGEYPERLKMDTVDMDILKRIVDQIDLGEDGIQMKYRLESRLGIRV